MHWIDLQVADRNGFIGSDTDKSVRIDILKFGHPSDRFYCAPRRVDRHLGILCDHGKSGYVVCVFMGQENTVDIIHVEADFSESIHGPLPADANVHQKVGVGGSYVNTIAAASAGNTFKSHGYYFLFLFLFLYISFFKRKRM